MSKSVTDKEHIQNFYVKALDFNIKRMSRRPTHEDTCTIHRL